MKKKRLYFFATFTGLLLSSIMQLAILTQMQNRTPIEQTFVLFGADLALVFMVDKVKHRLKHNTNG